MPIQMRLIDNLYCPIVVCDYCGVEIDDANEGNYEWRVSLGEVVTGEIYFTHKTCCLGFEKSHGGRDNWYTGGLHSLPVFLVRNLKTSWSECLERTKY